MYPTKRLIVFAGVNNQDQKLVPIRARKADAIMASFELLKPTKRGKPRDGGYYEWLDHWPQYRYLDSGVYTLTSRLIKTGSDTNATIAARAKREKVIHVRDVVEHLRSYIAYIEQVLDKWDWVVETDLDLIELTRDDGTLMPGYEWTLWSREKLHAVAGDRLIPVWHYTSDDAAAFTNLRALVRDYRYIGIGSANELDASTLRRVCDIAHEGGVLVHGFGTSKVDVLERVPYDTADSSTWLSGQKFGQYGGITYTNRRSAGTREIRRMRAFEDKVRAMGYDPADLLKRPPDGYIQHEVAIAMMQARQDEVPPIPSPLTHVPLGLE